MAGRGCTCTRACKCDYRGLRGEPPPVSRYVARCARRGQTVRTAILASISIVAMAVDSRGISLTSAAAAAAAGSASGPSAAGWSSRCDSELEVDIAVENSNCLLQTLKRARPTAQRPVTTSTALVTTSTALVTTGNDLDGASNDLHAGNDHSGAFSRTFEINRATQLQLELEIVYPTDRTRWFAIGREN